MHVHGGGGADLMDGEVDAVIRMAESQLKVVLLVSFLPRPVVHWTISF